ncbi:FitA-like ribbon-helix-helix domain-containing protein [Cellulomonas hominis]
MTTITVRNLDPEVQRLLKVRASGHNRSMEAEARAILSAAVSTGNLAHAWLRLADAQRGAELALPPRSLPREIDLG